MTDIQIKIVTYAIYLCPLHIILPLDNYLRANSILKIN